eukprot:snap_masked-scaffold5_size1054832-processed-gene-9.16 protein:Tk04065 transcript:snap_masked-scaffold5_size1054832-processed-gene-9.16-mRNA-1 annotation:"glycosylphosphatidylinositol anchor attachment 1 protein"
MGLLTNPNSAAGHPVVQFLRRYANRGAIGLYLLGVASFLLLAHPFYTHSTYFSENALLPGLVDPGFNEDKLIHSTFASLKEEAQNYPNSVPFPWLEAQFRQLGLEVYNHNFTLNYPLGRGNKFTGQNVYAILRAPRASSHEALVFSVPYRPPYSLDEGTDASLAVLIASAKYFSRQNYWAKDLIFLVTQHEQLGMQAWLEAYHQRSCGSGVLNHGDLAARAGSIQAAINLEMASLKMTHFNVRLEGLNGQLPNLDLFNLVNRLCLREGVGKMFQGVEDLVRSDMHRPRQVQDPFSTSWKEYQRALSTLFSMASKQATGVPSGNHGLFHRFGIEALTLEGVHYKKPRSAKEASMASVGRVVESVFRSLNNLLERFHQSFFFYLLPNSSQYVSIGIQLPRPISVAGASVNLEAEDAIGLGLIIFSVYCLILPKFLKNAVCVTVENWAILKCLILLEIAILAFSVALCNFSLAFFVTALSAPIALMSGPSSSGLKRSLKIILTLLVHPLVLLTIVCCVDTVRSFSGYPLSKLLLMCLDATKRALCYSITDGFIYGSHNFLFGALLHLPCWHILWSFNFIHPVPDLKTEEIAALKSTSAPEDTKALESKKDK